jgi:CIC family chloride channel protein
MQTHLAAAQAWMTVEDFVRTLSPHAHHDASPVFEEHQLLGAVTLWAVLHVQPDKWKTTQIGELVDARIGRVAPDCDVTEALRLLLSEHTQPMLLVVSEEEKVMGIVTKTDILHALKTRKDAVQVGEPLAL